MALGFLEINGEWEDHVRYAMTAEEWTVPGPRADRADLVEAGRSDRPGRPHAVDAPDHGRGVAEELFDVLLVAVGRAPPDPVARRRLLARAKLSTAPALV